MQLIAGLTRRYRRLPAVEIAMAAAWAIELTVIEVVGRRSNTDLADAVLLLGLGTLVLATALVHALWGLWMVAPFVRVWQILKKRSTSFKVEFGVDLRGTPSLPRGFPLTSWGAIVCSSGIPAAYLGFSTC